MPRHPTGPLRSAALRSALVCAGLGGFLGAAIPAQASEADAEYFRRRALAVNPAKREQVLRLRDELAAAAPLPWDGTMQHESSRYRRHVGAVRLELARSLPSQRVASILEAVADDPERLVRVVENLAGHRTLGSELVRGGHVDALVSADDRKAVRAAVVSFLEADDALARDLLRHPVVAADLAEELSDEPLADGLLFVVDVVLGRHACSPEALAAMAVADLNPYDLQVVRPIPSERRTALIERARTTPDRRLRHLIGDLLWRANERGTGADVLAAWGSPCPVTVDPDHLSFLPRSFDHLPAPDDCVAWMRMPLVRGHLRQASMWSVHETPIERYRLAGALADLYAASEAAWERGLLLRTFERHAYALDAAKRRSTRRQAPYLTLLDALANDTRSEPDELTRLRLRVVARLRREAERGDPSGPPAMGIRSLPGEVSPVLAQVRAPDSVPADVDQVRALAKAWLALDPDHLHDPAVRRALARWDVDDRMVLLSGYPEADIRRLLGAPPTEYLDDRGGWRVMDPAGIAGRDALLGFLSDDPRHGARIADVDLVAAWPARNRATAGKQLLSLDSAPSHAELAAVLADDEVAFAYFTAALDSAVDDDADSPIRHDRLRAAVEGCARLIAGLEERPVLFTALVDDAAEVRSLRVTGQPLAPEVRDALIERMRVTVDPNLAWLAARLLARTADPVALDALFAADGRLWAAVDQDDPPVVDLAYAAGRRGVLSSVLRYVARADAAPHGRVGAYSVLTSMEWIDARIADDAAPELVEHLWREQAARLCRWTRDEVPGFTPDVAEEMLEHFLEMDEGEQAGLSDAAMAAIRRDVGNSFDATVEALPTAASRFRLRRLAAREE